MDTLVVVQSMPGKPAVDLESVLFLDKGSRPLGKVFDVIGPVSLPLYCVRFNSHDHIKEAGVSVGTSVYVAPRYSSVFFRLLIVVALTFIYMPRGRDFNDPGFNQSG